MSLEYTMKYTLRNQGTLLGRKLGQVGKDGKPAEARLNTIFPSRDPDEGPDWEAWRYLHSHFGR